MCALSGTWFCLVARKPSLFSAARLIMLERRSLNKGGRGKGGRESGREGIRAAAPSRRARLLIQMMGDHKDKVDGS
jgi:hypothetical protein